MAGGLQAVPKPQGRVLNPEFVAYVRSLPCVFYPGVEYEGKRGRIYSPCVGRTEANHAGPRPLGRKSHDDESLPMCSGAHHPAWTDYTGFFSPDRMTLAERHAWRDEKIALVRKAFAEHREAAEEGGVPW